eukprot:403331031
MAYQSYGQQEASQMKRVSMGQFLTRSYEYIEQMKSTMTDIDLNLNNIIAQQKIKQLKDLIYLKGVNADQLYKQYSFPQNKLDLEKFTKMIQDLLVDSDYNINQKEVQIMFNYIYTKGFMSDDKKFEIKKILPYINFIQILQNSEISKDWENVGLRKIRDWMVKKQLNSDQAFERILKLNNKSSLTDAINREEFRKALLIEQLPFTLKQIDFLYKALDLNHDNAVQIKEWKTKVFDDFRNPLQMLRETILFNEINADELLHQMRLRTYEDILDFQDFAKAMHYLDTQLNHMQLQILYSEIKNKETNKIEARTLLQYLLGDKLDMIDIRDKVYQALFEKCQKVGFEKILESFEKLDQKNQGLQQIIEKLFKKQSKIGFKVSQDQMLNIDAFALFIHQKVHKIDLDQIKNLIKFVDLDKDNMLSINDLSTCLKNAQSEKFIQSILQSNQTQSQFGLSTLQGLSLTSQQLPQEKLIEVLRQIRQEMNAQNINDKQLFKFIDKNGTGFINFTDFSEQLNKIVSIAHNIKEKLFAFMDRNSTGLVNQLDFEKFIRYQGDSSSQDDQTQQNPKKQYQDSFSNEQRNIEQIKIVGLRSQSQINSKVQTSIQLEFDWRLSAVQQIKNYITSVYQDLKVAFEDFSEYKNQITYHQFKKTIEKRDLLKGFNLSIQLLQELFAFLDPHKKGYLTLQDFKIHFDINREENVDQNLQKHFESLKHQIQTGFADVYAAFNYFKCFKQNALESKSPKLQLRPQLSQTISHSLFTPQKQSEKQKQAFDPQQNIIKEFEFTKAHEQISKYKQQQTQKFLLQKFCAQFINTE